MTSSNNMSESSFSTIFGENACGDDRLRNFGGEGVLASLKRGGVLLVYALVASIVFIFSFANEITLFISSQAI